MYVLQYILKGYIMIWGKCKHYMSKSYPCVNTTLLLLFTIEIRERCQPEKYCFEGFINIIKLKIIADLELCWNYSPIDFNAHLNAKVVWFHHRTTLTQNIGVKYLALRQSCFVWWVGLPGAHLTLSHSCPLPFSIHILILPSSSLFDS